MPGYDYQNPETGEIKTIIQGMRDEHCFVDENGLKWIRIWHIPNAQIDTRINPFSEKEFVEKTRNTKGNIGDWLDRSEEMSFKRAEKNGGVDPVRVKAEEDYSKRRGGKKLPKSNDNQTFTI